MRSILAGSAAALALVAAAASAQERIFVDQWSPTESVLYIADSDGANARKLVAGSERDYNASFSFDDEWVVFTSERHGSADIFRVRADGMGIERLTDHPAFDDHAALSPDGRSLAFVSTRDHGSTDIYVLDVQTGEVRNLTDTPGGDYRPSWSPDGRWLAFSSERGKPPRMAAGRWEHVHEPSVYVMRADGGGVRRLTGDGQLAGSPRWVGGRPARGLLRAGRRGHLPGARPRRSGAGRVARGLGRCGHRRAHRARIGARAEAVAPVPRGRPRRLARQVGAGRNPRLQRRREGRHRRHRQPVVVARPPPRRLPAGADRDHREAACAGRGARRPRPAVRAALRERLPPRCRPTGTGSSSASAPAAAVPTTGRGSPSGAPTAATPGASSGATARS